MLSYAFNLISFMNVVHSVDNKGFVASLTVCGKTL